MPKLSNKEFDELLSEYALEDKAGERLTGEEFFNGVAAETDAQIYLPGTCFGDLPPSERFAYDLIAETAEEVLAEEKSKGKGA